MEETISVVIPTYNHEEFIAECLSSVHEQTFGDVELIIVDDCSADQAFEVASAILSSPFSRRFRNVQCMRNAENLGAHATINRGIGLATGARIALMNSDDRYRPARLQVLRDAMNEAGSHLAFSAVELFGDGAVVPMNLALLRLKQELAIESHMSMGFAALTANIAISTGNTMFSAELYRSAGPLIGLKYCHDWDFFLQACRFTEPVYVSEALYDYRLHKSNSFSSYSHIAELESEVVVSRFINSVVAGRPRNSKCPSPQHWPGYFELFLDNVGFGGIWSELTGRKPKSNRTYNDEANRESALARKYRTIWDRTIALNQTGSSSSKSGEFSQPILEQT